MSRLTLVVGFSACALLGVVVYLVAAGGKRPTEPPEMVESQPDIGTSPKESRATRSAFSGVNIGSIRQEGIQVEFGMEHVAPRAGASDSIEFREGDDVVFSFRISDTARGAALTSSFPAAWMVGRTGQTTTPKQCVKKVESLIGGSLFYQAELDLNVYYVLTLNEDSVSVVDPLSGFSGFKLLAQLPFDSPTHDWTLSRDEQRLFVSLPQANQIAVVATDAWQEMPRLKTESAPSRLAVQPDGRYLWVACEGEPDSPTAAVIVFDTDQLERVATIRTGRGPHSLAFSDDSRHAFIANAGEGSVTLVDVGRLKKVADLPTGGRPVTVAYSDKAACAYVSDERTGDVLVIDPVGRRITNRIPLAAGIGPMRFAPGGRYAIVLNPQRDLLHVLDAASNRIVQTGQVEDEPDQIAFSDDLVYVRHRGSEQVLMVPLDKIGREGQPLPIVEFPAGQAAPGTSAPASPADAIVQAPGANAVLVANPIDNSVYFYKEGMAAPMGTFKIRLGRPRAVLAIDRSLRERFEPGLYQTTAKLRRPGQYDVVFFLDSPRIVHCFPIEVHPDPELQQIRMAGKVKIEPMIEDYTIGVGRPVRLQFKIVDEQTETPKTNLADVRVLTFLAPGTNQRRQQAREIAAGVYAVDFTPAKAGVYYVYLACDSLGIPFENDQFVVLLASDADESRDDSAAHSESAAP